MNKTTELWEFKYAPKTIDEMVLREDIKKRLKKCLVDIPNMTIAGPPGVGKGTFMSILESKKDIEIMKINGSDETGIDAIRNRVKPFAESIGVTGKVKVVYINEADRLSLHAQDMLRDLIEKVFDITRFILLCNHPDRITNEILSRCPLLVIDNPPIKEIGKRCIKILKLEKIKYDSTTVIKIIKSTYPDIRSTINTLKYNIIDGVLSNDIVIKKVTDSYDDIVNAMKKGDPTEVRKILRSAPVDYTDLYEYLYNLVISSDDDVFSNDLSALYNITEGAYRNDIVTIKEISFMNMYLSMLKDGSI